MRITNTSTRKSSIYIGKMHVGEVKNTSATKHNTIILGLLLHVWFFKVNMYFT